MVFRRRRSQPPLDPLTATVDPGSLPPGRRAPVIDALGARDQFRRLVASVPEGPLRQRLGEMGERVDAGVLAVWQTVQHSLRLDSVASTLDPERATAELKAARRAADAGRADPATVEALALRFASTQRLLNARDELDRRLPLLEARLATAVARAAELTLTSPASGAPLDDLSGELDELVVELEALRAGFDAVP